MSVSGSDSDKSKVDFTAVIDAVTPALTETPAIVYYRSDDADGYLFFEKGAQWFRINAYAMNGSARPELCDPVKEGWELDPIGEKNGDVARMYAPIRSEILDSFHQIIERLPLQELEALIPLLLVHRNSRTYERDIVARAVGLNKKAISRRHTDPWYYQHPDGSPLADEEKQKVALEMGAARENPARDRDLRIRDTDTNGLIICSLADNRFGDVPFWEAHKRGRNWAARIKNAYRTFLKSKRNPPETGPEYATVSHDRNSTYTLESGDLIEFAADYYSPLNEKVQSRQYCIIESITADAITFRPIPDVLTLKDAEKAAKELVKK